jgi:hypothetical protein
MTSLSFPTLKSTLESMTLNNDTISIHLEINKDAFWKLTKVAADDQQFVEEWLENYLSTAADQLLEELNEMS